MPHWKFSECTKVFATTKNPGADFSKEKFIFELPHFSLKRLKNNALKEKNNGSLSYNCYT